jgi:hypothetical protein
MPFHARCHARRPILSPQHIVSVVTLSSPRYTRTPFPPYAYRPGRNPHPARPGGHGGGPGGAAAGPRPVAPADWARSADYLYGCDLYNHGYWWEAHEAWEGLWQLADRAAAQGRFLQGLIQLSACALKVAAGNRRGAARLLERGCRHLEAALALSGEPRFMGLELPGFLARVQGYYRTRLAADPPAHDARSFPHIVLARGWL